MDKQYQPIEVEERWRKRWRDEHAFAQNVPTDNAAHTPTTNDTNAAPYTIMMPPPNVTGALHIGHALTFTLQDILIRYHRMAGREVLWQAGVDHAGIATQMVVERQLSAKGISRHALGRKAFVDEIWKWKEESGSTIISQLDMLGASTDWSKGRFTMDDGMSAAVLKVFTALYKQGLIYRDKRLVNWDPKLRTAVSDLEVQMQEIPGHLWHIRYDIPGAKTGIVVATTRPETMFGDTAIAVHPDDKRYQKLIGKTALIPVTGRAIPIIADAGTDMEKGSGAVKITPAHDFHDYDVGRTHNLPLITIIDEDAKLQGDEVPDALRGLDRFAARKALLEGLESSGALVETVAIVHPVPHGDRSGVVLEPRLTDQWYIDAKTMAQPAIKAVEDGRTRFVPDNWQNTYFEWLRNIQPWCISRQLWWGHQIPAWYGPDGKIFVAETEEEALLEATQHYGEKTVLTRDPDVLDTWFSSALWPFATLGWPNNMDYVNRHYPGDVLVTGFDIIFFWVARMMMMGMHFMGDVPFRTVYIHPLVRDEKGQKMSKSNGNVIDPLTWMKEYGTDAVRFTLAALAAPGRDIKLSRERVETSRNFITKLWNAVRYVTMQGAPDKGFSFESVGDLNSTVNRWIVSRILQISAEVDAAAASYTFHQWAHVVYQGLWDTFCSHYLEFTKPMLQGADETMRRETLGVLYWCIDQFLRLLHPICPFVTEEISASLNLNNGELLSLSRGVQVGTLKPDTDALKEMDWVCEVVAKIRGVRAAMNVPAGAKVPLCGDRLKAPMRGWFMAQEEIISRMARCTYVPDAAGIEVDIAGQVLLLDIRDAIDIEAESKRLQKEFDKAEAESNSLQTRLANPDFIAKAKPEIIDDNRARLVTLAETLHNTKESMQRLGSLKSNDSKHNLG